MFKNSKEINNINIPETDETEQTYKQQLKMLNSRIQEQQNNIDKLVDFVSARFGEDFSESDINKKIQKIEKSVDKIKSDTKYQEIINKLSESFKIMDSIVSSNKNKIEELFTRLDNFEGQDDAYKSGLKKEFKDTFSSLDTIVLENEKKVEELSNRFKQYEKEDSVYKKYIFEGFKQTDSAIKEINYSGITKKFEKILNEKNKNVETRLKNLNAAIDEKLNKIEEFTTTLQSNDFQINEINQIIESMTDQTEKFATKLEKNIQDYNDISSDVTKLYKIIQKNEEAVAEVNKALKNNYKDIDYAIKSNEHKTSSIETDINNYKNEILKDIDDIKAQNIDANAIISGLQNSLEETTNNIQLIKANCENENKAIKDYVNTLVDAQQSSNNEAISNSQMIINTIKKDIDDIKAQNIDANAIISGLQNSLEETTKSIQLVKTNYENENNAIKDYVDTLVDAQQSSNNEAISNSQMIINTMKKEINQSIKSINQELISTNKKALEQSERIKNSLYKYDEKISNKIKTVRQDVVNNNQSLKEFVNQQIQINSENSIAEINKSKAFINDIKSDLDKTIQNVESELLKLNNDTKLIKEKQTTSDDLTSIKKEYNQYVKKVENTINSMNTSINKLQEKNVQASNNLQVKIKAYIDNKNTKQINQVNDIINELNLSIIEREKLQQEKTEQMINKKLKEIQKENERILNKKIEELNDYMRRNNAYSNTKNIQKIDEYKPVSKKKKSIYEKIDTNQMLKQSASNKNILQETKEKKSQLLKFFYDDDDVN